MLRLVPFCFFCVCILYPIWWLSILLKYRIIIFVKETWAQKYPPNRGQATVMCNQADNNSNEGNVSRLSN